MNNLEVTISNCLEAAYEVQRRLNSVLRDQVPVSPTASDEMKTAHPLVPLAQRIKDSDQAVSNMLFTLNNILGRLEV